MDVAGIPGPSRYYWWICKHFGRECYKTWRAELFASVVVVLFTFLIKRDWKDLNAALLATALTLSCFAIWHLLRAPFLLHKQILGAEEEPSAGAGIFGLLIVIGLVVGGYEMIAEMWKARPVEDINVVFTTKDHPGTDAEISRLHGELEKKRKPDVRVAGDAGRSQPPQQANQPSQSPLPPTTPTSDPSLESTNNTQKAFIKLNKAIGNDPNCLIRITALDDTRKMASDFRTIVASALTAANSKCKVEGPYSFDYNPDMEKEAKDGAIPGRILFHAARNQTWADNFFGALDFVVPVKRSFDVPKGSPPAFVWLQFGSGLKWRN